MSDKKSNRTSGTPASIHESLKKATTELLVLFVLRQKPMYTYEMMQTIKEMSGGKFTFNTLYQAIYRLQSFRYIREHGKVISEDNRTRIYFTITDTGENYFRQILAQYHSFTATMEQILAQGELPPQEDCTYDHSNFSCNDHGA